MIDAFVQDFRYAVRQLRNSRGFTIVAVVTLALGIGANTAIFSIVEGVVLARLPYFQSDRLVMIWESNPHFPRVWNSYPNFQDWQRSAHSFQQMAAFREQGVDLTFPGAASHINASQISSGFFRTLGTPLVLGREFEVADGHYLEFVEVAELQSYLFVSEGHDGNDHNLLQKGALL